MPNADPHENQFPPGLAFSPRTSLDRYQSSTHAFAPGPSDQHSLSSSFGMSAAAHNLASSVPRSYGIYDRELSAASDAWGVSSPPKHAQLPTQSSQQQQGGQSHPFGINSLIPSHHSAPHAVPGAVPSAGATFNFDSTSFVPSAVSSRESSLRAQPAREPMSFPLNPSPAGGTPYPPSDTARTLYWGDLEPWMDEEYAKQVISFMKWEATVRIPSATPETAANNPGYCYLTFPTPTHAAGVLSLINSKPVSMPNSNKQFTLSWASSTPIPAASSSPPAQAFPKEYSIFVGDLAPEASNSDLVAVFRNPVLGLRNDREPKFIRPFHSCKSAKIMLDPATGISRGYGFVRFTDEADQQRALIEMHGLYCLSRPMRISPATAKFKPQQLFEMTGGMQGASQAAFDATSALHSSMTPSFSAVEKPASSQMPPTASVSSSIATPPPFPAAPATATPQSSSTPTSSMPKVEEAGIPPTVLAHIAQIAASASKPAPAAPALATLGSVSAPYSGQPQPQPQAQGHEPPRFSANTSTSASANANISDESWKHSVQARAILSNLIGPHGEQLTSSDPYNTTVFVGGLSPLISEETLRTFFAPFGDIHYVKVPAGKHCGFVQFVRKGDAERAIEKMQGFPIGGSRIRLSWGRSQYKAAQAAAQAAQAAAMQAMQQPALPPAQPVPQPQVPVPVQSPPQPQPQQPQAQVQPQLPQQSQQPAAPVALTPEQAVQILRSLGFTNFVSSATTTTSPPPANQQTGPTAPSEDPSFRRLSEETIRNLVLARADEAGVAVGFGDIYNASSSGSPPSRSDVYLSSSPPVRADMYTSSSPPARSDSSNGAEESRMRQSVSFAPFSPDSSMYPDAARRAGMLQLQPTMAAFLGGADKTGANVNGAAAEFTPRGIPQHTSRPASNSLSSAVSAISRPPSSKRASPPRGMAPSPPRADPFEVVREDFEDVNGTLASLDLNSHEQDASA